jgi:hypothetical protein
MTSYPMARDLYCAQLDFNILAAANGTTPQPS